MAGSIQNFLMYLKENVNCVKSSSVFWLGFDKYEKIIYGIRYGAERKFLQLIQCNLFAGQKVKSVKIFSLEYPHLFVDAFPICTFSLSRSCQFLGIISAHRYASYYWPNYVLFFHLISLENFTVKNYTITDLMHTAVKNSSDLRLINCETFGFVLRTVQPVNDNRNFYFYYKIILNDKSMKAALDFLTSFPTEIKTQYADEIILNGRLIIFECENLRRVHVFDLVEKSWGVEGVFNSFVKPEDGKLTVLPDLKGENSSFYALVFPYENLMKCKFDLKEWQTMAHDVNFVKRWASKCHISGFANDKVVVVSGRSIERDYDEIEGEITTCSHLAVSSFNVLPLEDLAMKQLVYVGSDLLHLQSEREIFDVFNLPRILIRKYFGSSAILFNAGCTVDSSPVALF